VTVPNFLIIGAARSGTTALCNTLGQHPEIYISSLKEPHFLAFSGEKLEFRGPGDNVLINREAVTNFEAYQSLFSGVCDEIAIGEGSVSTLYYNERAIDNIRRFTPDAKLIVILRNPIQRAFSSFLYMTAHGHEPLHQFERALDQEQQRINDNWHHIWHYTRMGLYGGQIAAFLNAFGAERVKVVLFEDLKLTPAETTADLFRFLNVNPDFEADTSTQVNRSGIPRSRLLQYVLYQVNERQTVKRALKAIVPLKVREWVRRANLSHPSMPVSTQTRLKAVFEQDVLQLQELLNRDLSHWL
jgi:hypothetical protein